MAIWNRCAICGRAIPVGEPCYGVKDWRGDPIGGDTICRDCLVLENEPTLTPPNEPLTCEGCACKEYSRDSYPCNSCFRNDETLSDQYRPPEGEA